MNHFLNEAISFYEIQRFEQKFLKWVVIISALFPLLFFMYGYYVQTIENVQFGDKPLSNDGLLISILIASVFAFAILYLFFASKMETYITPSGLHIRLFPFMKFKTYDFEDIRKIKVRKYKPLLDYGGWGIRIGPFGRAFNMHGNMGLQIVFNDGKKVLVGSQMSEQLFSAVSQYVNNNQEQI